VSAYMTLTRTKRYDDARRLMTNNHNPRIIKGKLQTMTFTPKSEHQAYRVELGIGVALCCPETKYLRRLKLVGEEATRTQLQWFLERIDAKRAKLADEPFDVGVCFGLHSAFSDFVNAQYALANLNDFTRQNISDYSASYFESWLSTPPQRKEAK